ARHLRRAPDRRDRRAAQRDRGRREGDAKRAVPKGTAVSSVTSGASAALAGGSPDTGPARAELLRVEHLSRHFGGFAAVSELSFHVDEGEVVGLVGPNGAGKTTTFNVVTGFLKPSTGRVVFRGEDVTGLPPHVLARRGLVRTFQ